MRAASSRRYPLLQSIPEHEPSDVDSLADESACCNEKEGLCQSPPASPTTVLQCSGLPPRHNGGTRKHFVCAAASSKVHTTSAGTSKLLLRHVNQERTVRGLQPFRSSRLLNQLAMQHASAMARSGHVYHSVSTIDELKVALFATGTNDEVAENIQRGDSVLEMHLETMDPANPINRSNILCRYFTECGCGVAVGAHDGKVYCCQLFRS